MGKQIAVMASGGGSNLQALLDAWRSGKLGSAKISLVVSDKPDAKALQRAITCDVATRFFDPAKYPERGAYDRALIDVFKEKKIDLICLAGYMRILTSVIVEQFPMKIMNIHPSLLPAFGGAGMYGRHVHRAVIASGAKYSGCTVHFVDEGTDTGPIILQHVVPVLDHDTPEKLAERVLIEEHRIYPRAVSLFCEGCLAIEEKRVKIIEKA
ncbi:phosphoribosylglycinamide formyltransferase [bacterium]|nr:phosphoribosylglycinamide formyltransferase [bacterium]